MFYRNNIVHEVVKSEKLLGIRLALEQHCFHICEESVANDYCQQLLSIEVVIVVDIFGTGWAAVTINLRNAGLLQ